MSKNEETNIQNGILVQLSAAGHLPFRCHVGIFRAMDNPDRIVKIGTPGMSDIFDIAPVTITPEMVGKTVGVAVCCEVKTLTGKLRKNQELWQLAAKKRGAICLVTRSVDQVIDQISKIPNIICGK